MLYRWLLVCLLMFFPFVAWSSGWQLTGSLFANETDLLELVKRHDDIWRRIDSLQVAYSRSYKAGGVLRSFPDCYWESGGDRTRAIVMTLKNDVEVFEDVFCDGKDSYKFVVPRSLYPLSQTEIKLCDYANLSYEGYRATFIPNNVVSAGVDVRMSFPLLKYFFVHTEENWMTLLELVNKYPSNMVSTQKNTFGDELIEIVVEDHVGKHEQLGAWKLNIFINTNKGYNIDGYRFATATKTKPSIEMITECIVKKYSESKEGYWVPRDWESIQHNGNPAVGIQVNYSINDYRINGSLKSRLNDFRFPVNFPVMELTPADQPEKIHIWGAENKPIRSFDSGVDFLEYYSNECMTGELPQENKHLALRISLVVLGLIMIIVALYRLYAKER